MVELFYIRSLSEFMFYFTFYSFLGWMIENTYNLITNGKFIKGNYLIGPFKPMYGFTPILLISMVKPNMSWVMILLICYFVPLIVEYITGDLLLKLFNLRYWDYSTVKFNLNGHVCLLFSIYWLLLAFICIKWVHPIILTFYLMIETLWSYVYIAVIIYFITDIIKVTQVHVKLRSITSNVNPVH